MGSVLVTISFLTAAAGYSDIVPISVNLIDTGAVRQQQLFRPWDKATPVRFVPCIRAEIPKFHITIFTDLR